MADISKLIDGLLSAAKVATALIPGTTDDAIVGVGEKLADLIGDLTDKAPDTRTATEMQTQRKALRDAVIAKANKTADRFDG